MSVQENDANEAQKETETRRWFEKSVEYQFVSDAIHKQLFSLIIPLDGPIEKIGDTIFLQDSKYVIVEFKETLTNLSAEYAKYRMDKTVEPQEAFEKVAAAFKVRAEADATSFWHGRHHFLVGGRLDPDAESEPQKLGLDIAEYFSAANPQGPNRFARVPIERVMDKGIAKAEFDLYVDELLRHKTDESDDDPERGGGGNRALSIVIGIAANAVSIVPLKKYELALKLKLQLGKKPKQ